MKNRNRATAWALCGLMVLSAGAGVRAAAQTNSAAQARRATAQSVSATPPSDQEVADTQEQLIKLLRMSPTLTTVIAHDPSLLSDAQYVQRNNPELAQFLAEHPDVAQNPEFYLFSQINPRDGRRDQALERAVWPEFAGPPRDGFDAGTVMDRVAPMVVAALFFTALVWIIRLFVENRRWNQTFKQQSEVHARLIDKFSTSQELAAYMETEAGRRFLEAAPTQLGAGMRQHMPNAVARILTPLQIGFVLSLLGVGLLLIRHASPDTDVPMLVLGTLALMPGIGFILSAGATWVLAHRLGLLPENPSEAAVVLRERL
jgi:hypothetical protein